MQWCKLHPWFSQSYQILQIKRTFVKDTGFTIICFHCLCQYTFERIRGKQILLFWVSNEKNRVNRSFRNQWKLFSRPYMLSESCMPKALCQSRHVLFSKIKINSDVVSGQRQFPLTFLSTALWCLGHQAKGENELVACLIIIIIFGQTERSWLTYAVRACRIA